MEVKKLNVTDVSDFRSLVEIFKIAFENEEEIADSIQLAKLLSNPDFLVFVVKKNNIIVGGLTIYLLHSYYHSKPVAYIYDVAISPAFQGQGLGKKLISKVCKYCATHGFEDAYVEAESDDIAAVNFYRKTNYSSEIAAIHFTYRNLSSLKIKI